jgi:tetratricopeptide (TPR) repeat protein
VTVQEAINLGLQHHQAGNLAEAESVYRQILSQQPNLPDALHLLGIAAGQRGQRQASLELISRAAAQQPVRADFCGSLGRALAELGRTEEAAGAYRRAISLDAKAAHAYAGLGTVLARQGKGQAALECLRQAIQLEPNCADFHAVLGNILSGLGRVDDAIGFFDLAVRLDHCQAEYHSNLGNVYLRQGKLDLAITWFGHAVSLKPDNADALGRLGEALYQKGEVDRAESMLRRALALRPQFPSALLTLGRIHLLRGEFEKGWPLLESRRRLPGAEEAADRRGTQWDGGDLTGKRILLWAEPGVEDAIQFIRYVPLVAERGGTVILACQPELIGLAGGVAGVQEKIQPGDALPRYDVHCPLASLPLMFKTTAENIPAKIPYLAADEGLAEKWRQRLGPEDGRLKIGIACQGDEFSSLWAVGTAREGKERAARFFWLRKPEAARPPQGMDFTDLSGEVAGLSDMAALIDNLDLVITTDTPVAHIAGALGRPVWVLLPFACDWRWMLERGDSPWYPTMRLFRQSLSRQWDVPVQEAAAALGDF